MRISELQSEAWRIAEEKGFHKGRTASRDDTLVRLCLIHSEVSEATQEVKRHWVEPINIVTRERVAEEMADILIRCADLAACIGANLEASVEAKLKKNEGRLPGYGTPHEGRAEGI